MTLIDSLVDKMEGKYRGGVIPAEITLSREEVFALKYDTDARISELEKERDQWERHWRCAVDQRDQARAEAAKYQELWQGAEAKWVNEAAEAARYRAALGKVLTYCKGGDPCAGSEHQPCHIHEHEVAREALQDSSGVDALAAIRKAEAALARVTENCHRKPGETCERYGCQESRSALAALREHFGEHADRAGK